MMTDILFYLFSGLVVAASFLMVTSRNPVNAAMFLILAFLASAGLFALLEAFFLAMVQALVYAGAVVVLFLFIIMLLQVDKARRIRPEATTVIAASAGFALLLLGFIVLFALGGAGNFPATPIEEAPAALARNFGYALFTKYLLPFQMTGFLLLIAMVGVIHISRRVNRANGQAAAETGTEGEQRV